MADPVGVGVWVSSLVGHSTEGPKAAAAAAAEAAPGAALAGAVLRAVARGGAGGGAGLPASIRQGRGPGITRYRYVQLNACVWHLVILPRSTVNVGALRQSVPACP